MTEVQETPEDEADQIVLFGGRLRLSADRAEWVVGIVLAVAAVVMTTFLARDMWFNNDEWEYLANRSAFDGDSLLRPVGGHWTTWTVLLLRGIYGAVGLDFWPWFYIPRLIGHTLLVTFIWRVVRHRGADRLVGLLTYAVLLVLGASGYQRALQVGNWVVYAALIVSALVICRRPADPSVRDRVIVAGALLLAVPGNGYALAAIGGITLALVLARRIVVWIPSLLPALVAYGAWYLAYGGSIKDRPGATVSGILGIPADGFRVIRTAVESATDIPTLLASVVVLALLAWIVLLFVRRRLDLFDSIFLCTLGVGLALLTVQRIATSAEIAGRVRYGYSVSILLALALVPHIRLPRSLLVRGAVTVGVIGMVVANLAVMEDEIQLREDVGQNALVRSGIAASMMLAGEPVVTSGSQVVPFLVTSELQHLVDDGYRPEIGPGDPEWDASAPQMRGILRMNAVGPGFDALPAGDLPTTSAEVDADGCLTVEPGTPTTADVTDAAMLEVRHPEGKTLHLTWTDEFGTGVRAFSNARRPVIELAEPIDSAELTLETRGTPIVVCGFALGGD